MALVAAGVAVALAVVVLAPPGGRQAAAALTPPALDYTSTGLTPGEVLQEAISRLQTTGADGRPSRAARYTGWYLQREELPEGASRVAISPQVTDLVWRDDLSGRMTIKAGQPYWPDGSQDAIPGDAAAAPGEVIADREFAPGEFDTPFGAEPGQAHAAMEATLARARLPETAFGTVEAIHGLLTVWSLTDRQQAELLSILIERGGLEALGLTTDRSGREAFGLAA
ncbi:MAG: hypothetical protein LBD51_00365, partial [Bifidobacteriaceae bacterium]|nr:hypothetical protein [Bifidobacteriaceae bacterium]